MHACTPAEVAVASGWGEEPAWSSWVICQSLLPAGWRHALRSEWPFILLLP